VSAIVRTSNTPARSAPGTRSGRGREPVATTRASKAISPPLSRATTPRSRSIAATFVAVCSVMPCSAYQAAVLK
jgi:hypothetical protein